MPKKPNAYSMFLQEKVAEHNRNLREDEQKMTVTSEMFTDPYFSDEWTAKSAEERKRYKDMADKVNGKVKSPSNTQQSDAKVKVEVAPEPEDDPVQNNNWDYEVPRIIVGIGHGAGIPQDRIFHGSGGILSRGRGRGGLGHGRAMKMYQDYDMNQFKFDVEEEPEDVKPEVGWRMQDNPPKFEPEVEEHEDVKPEVGWREVEEPEDVKPEVGWRMQNPREYEQLNTYHF